MARFFVRCGQRTFVETSSSGTRAYGPYFSFFLSFFPDINTHLFSLDSCNVQKRPPTITGHVVLREEAISCLCQVEDCVWAGVEKRIYCIDIGVRSQFPGLVDGVTIMPPDKTILLQTQAMFHWTAHERTINDLYYHNSVVWSAANDGKIKVCVPHPLLPFITFSHRSSPPLAVSRFGMVGLHLAQ